MKTTLPVRRGHSALRHLALSFAKKFRTLLLASGLLIVFSMQANAQDDWKSLTTIDGVEISYQKTICEDVDVLLIKLVNTTSQDISLNLDYAFLMDGSKFTGGSFEQTEIGAGSEIAGTCSTGLKINVFDHLTMFDENMYSLKITKSE